MIYELQGGTHNDIKKSDHNKLSFFLNGSYLFKLQKFTKYFSLRLLAFFFDLGYTIEKE